MTIRAIEDRLLSIVDIYGGTITFEYIPNLNTDTLRVLYSPETASDKIKSKLNRLLLNPTCFNDNYSHRTCTSTKLFGERITKRNGMTILEFYIDFIYDKY